MMPRPIRFALGIPSYRNQIHVALGLALCDLGAYLTARQGEVACIWRGAESSFVDHSRNLLTLKAIKAGADVLVMCDSDTVWPSPPHLVELVRFAASSPAALVGVPYLKRGGEWVMRLPGESSAEWQGRPWEESWQPSPERTPYLLASGSRVGSGLCTLRLGWFVKNWPLDTMAVWQSRQMAGGVWWPEDYVLCDRIRELDGQIALDGRFAAIHYAPTRREDIGAW